MISSAEMKLVMAMMVGDFNPNHDPKTGQFVEGGDADGRSVGLTMNLKYYEKDIRRQPVEYGVLLASTGRLKFKKTDNNPGQVSYTYKEAKRMRDAVLTHNHPDSGGTFSPADLRCAVSTGLKEIRAVDKHYTYSLVRQFTIGKNIPSKYNDFSRDYGKYASSRRRYWSLNAKSGREATRKLLDDLNGWLEQNSASYGWQYERIQDYERK